MLDVEGYLVSKGLNVKRASASNVHVPCVFCGEDDSKRGRLYVNTDPNAEIPGLFICFLCGEKGSLTKLRRHFGDANDDKPEAWDRRHEILQEAARYFHQKLADREDVLRWLKHERGLTIDTIEKHEIGWADGSLRQHAKEIGFSVADLQKTGLVDGYGRDFLFSHVTIPYHVSGNVVLIRGKEIGGKYLTPPGSKTRLFNSDVTWGAEQLLVTEGEFDALVLEQLGYNAVGCPGANVWQDSWTAYAHDAKRVYVVFDNDAAGVAGAERLARLVGPKTRIVRMPEADAGGPKNDPTEWIVNRGHTREDFELLLVRAKGGVLLTVDDCFAEWQEVQQLHGLSLGLETLDVMIEPGLLPSQLMVYLAKTGAGKTVMLLNLFHRMLEKNSDVRILFVSLEQTRSEWFERARRIYRFYHLDSSDHDVLKFFRPRLMVVDKNRLSEEEFVSLIEQYEFEVGQKPDLIAVDYLGYWARSYRGEGYERTSSAVMSLKAIAKEHRVTILAPHQVNRGVGFGDEPDVDSSRESGVVEETADFVLTLWSPDQRRGRTRDEQTGEVNLKVGKSRHGGVGTIVRFQFAPLSLAMIPQGDPLILRAKEEHKMALAGDTFERAIEKHRAGRP